MPEGTAGAKKAVLSYEVVHEDEKTGLALVWILLHTGRHHQIRVQFAHAGYPLYGDVKYGPSVPEEPRFPLALCSCRLSFRHPSTGEEMEFEIQPSGRGFAVMGE